MRVFVTGATGWVGSAVVEDLIAAGHQVLVWLVRTRERTLWRRRARKSIAVRLKTWKASEKGAACSDGVIHTAFNPRLLEARGKRRARAACYRGNRW